MRPGFRYSILALVVVGFLACAGVFFPIEIAVYLAAGWVFFLARVGPGIKVDPGGMAIAFASLVLLAGLIHSFLAWLRRQKSGAPAWKARWTASLVAGLVLMFAAGIAAAGMAHQAAWLFTSPEPWVGFGDWARFRVMSSLNLRQIELAVANYEAAEKSYPAGTTLDDRGVLLHGWQARILPQMDQQEVYNQINFDVPWDDPANAAAIRTRIGMFLNPKVSVAPAPTAPAPSHYAGNDQVLGGDSPRRPADFSDGLASTIVMGEAAGRFKPWGHPANVRDLARGINRSPDGFGSPFPGGANFAFADGSVKFLSNQIDPKVLRALASPSGGEKVSLDDF
jgi:prepilin-type processing-associated H-X9-DG protein